MSAATSGKEPGLPAAQETSATTSSTPVLPGTYFRRPLDVAVLAADGSGLLALLLIYDVYPDNVQSAITTSDPAQQVSSNEGPSASFTKENIAQPGAQVSEKAQKKNSLLNVPSRTTSQTKQEPSSTSPPLTGATVTDDSTSVGRNSKRSILGKKRDVSKSSSRRASKEQRSLDAGRGAPPAPAVAQSDGATGVEKKGTFGFLSFLNCCSGHHNTNTMDIDDQALPAKKEFRENVAKDTSEEKQSSREETEKQEIPVAEEKKQCDGNPPRISPSESSREKPIVPSGPVVATETVDTSGNLRDQPLSAPVPDAQPSPVPLISTQEEVSPTPDWTPDQSKRNSDVDMPDAPSQEKEVAEHETTTSPALPKVEAQKTELPPPPPLEQRQSQVINREAPAVPSSSQEKEIWLLPPIQPHLQGRKCLVLDLDETLVHSSFKILNQADFTIPVEIEGQYHNVYVIKRPGVDAFMKRVGELYEVVVFTASVSKYGDPLLDQLDIHHVVHHRLFRESCYNHQGNYVKDLSQVGRDLRETIIIDNSPTSYIFHPQHAVPISSWFSDAHDNELLDLIPVLEDLAGAQVRDVSLVLDVAL
ncbi:hypothetical protein EPUS_02892 [Endocarpon pusillum Z07020]|uniref:FCP1 homology domain-containing protein n=1 Tax=Endocarpon pusillum (strain Z07020 / HMAS-L-300199) TaxID=1263415 RepID=U1GJU5_ENDPU|nr:uncharacterized protein EPUS_02892 [Endocarpon pusillum Z07020]ERF72101.1 hypothetical protein EPUS_02892 [Endocarpon pusillum Z07020]